MVPAWCMCSGLTAVCEFKSFQLSNYVFMCQRKLPPVGTAWCLLMEATHSHHHNPQGRSRGGPQCSQHPSEISKVCHLLLPCQNKTKQTKKTRKCLCCMLNPRRTDSWFEHGFRSSSPFPRAVESLSDPGSKKWERRGKIFPGPHAPLKD